MDITQKHIQWRQTCHFVSEGEEVLVVSMRKPGQEKNEVWDAMAPEGRPRIASVRSAAMLLPVTPEAPVFRRNVRSAGLLWPVNF
ncbi:MAG: hypothetical protein JW902_13275 [Syntrophaceae bacterium]|nr:hypothetical protein [Syntrophaceae bacterium]